MTSPDQHVTVRVSRKKRRSKQGRHSEGPLTSVTVSGRIRVGVAEYEVMSSDLYRDALDSTAWLPAIRDMVTRSRRAGGAGKGRVLYLLEAGGVPIAVLAYHVESSKEVVIRGAESVLALKQSEKDVVAVLLLHADSILRKHPSRHGAARLVWAVPKGDTRTVCDSYRFRVAGTAADGRQLLERRVTRT